MIKKHLLVVAFLVILLSINAFAQQWRPVSGSRQANISGMALISHEKQVTTILVVHDNKKKEQIHATVITINGTDAPTYTSLNWKGDNGPVDLEAVTAVPGAEGQFIALNADGHAFHFKVDLKSSCIEVKNTFDVPMIPTEHDFEGFALQKINNTLVAVWAERGLTVKSATIFWSKFDLDGDKFSDVGWTSFSVPYPKADVRHVADIKVDTTGAAFVVAASDPGNDGPFSSAAYFAGVFRIDDKGKVTFAQPSTLTPLFRFDYHKVEAFDFVPGTDGGMVFGTDDENLGAALFLTY